eukprot:gene17330-20626_t
MTGLDLFTEGAVVHVVRKCCPGLISVEVLFKCCVAGKRLRVRRYRRRSGEIGEGRTTKSSRKLEAKCGSLKQAISRSEKRRTDSTRDCELGDIVGETVGVIEGESVGLAVGEVGEMVAVGASVGEPEAKAVGEPVEASVGETVSEPAEKAVGKPVEAE